MEYSTNPDKVIDAKAFAVDNEIMAIKESGTMKQASTEEIYNQATINAQHNVLCYSDEYGVDARLLLNALEGRL